jgi:predicted flap endonuclease-1-like 5' DNA nuclease
VGLFWQIAVFLIATAVLGFAIGWVLRGARLEGERTAAAPRQSGAEAALEDERDRLRTELEAARASQAELEASLAESQNLAEVRASRVRELEAAEADSRQRIAGLEDELTRAKAAAGSPQADTVALEAAPVEPQPLVGPAAPPADAIAGTPPEGLAAPEGEPDDLQQISGIGPGIEKILHQLGIYHFRQIAQFTPDNVAWVNQRLRFRGRIEREDWIGQAKRLAAGETVERTSPPPDVG